MKKCKTCGKNCEGEYCFRHKPKKPLQVTRDSVKEFQEKVVQYANEMRNFLYPIWNRRLHYCESCGEWLGNEPLSYHFDHTLEKSKYPELKYEEDNIMLLCLQCHDKKTRGFMNEKITERIRILKKKYNIFD